MAKIEDFTGILLPHTAAALTTSQLLVLVFKLAGYEAFSWETPVRPPLARGEPTMHYLVYTTAPVQVIMVVMAVLVGDEAP